jgi:hypothetical protein
VIGSVRRVVGTLSASCALVGAVAAATPVAAQASSPIDYSLCDGAPLSQPFLQWGDGSEYKLAPGGDFEGILSGWTLSGGAAQGDGSESYDVTGSAGSSSLSLPEGASATSPQSCVNAAYPSFRFFARSDAPGTIVTASIVYMVGHMAVTIPVGAVAPSSSWQPSGVMATGGALAGLLSGGTANLSLKFSSKGGPAQVDDLFIDPSGRCC